MKIGDVVQSVGFANGMEQGKDYVVIAKSSVGGWFVQSVEDGSMPVAGYSNGRFIAGVEVGSWQGYERVAAIGYMPKQVKVVGRYIDYQAQQQFAFAA